MYVCMHACMYVCMCGHVWACVHARMYMNILYRHCLCVCISSQHAYVSRRRKKKVAASNPHPICPVDKNTELQMFVAQWAVVLPLNFLPPLVFTP